MDTAAAVTEIKIGSWVGLKKTHPDPGVQQRLEGWIKAYGRGPFRVCGMIDSSHVTLKSSGGKIIHFGSTDSPSFHIGHVEPWGWH